MDDGNSIILRRHGNPAGPMLVLCHGNGLAIDLYYPFWSLLTEEFDVIVHDLRNHGWNTVGSQERIIFPFSLKTTTVLSRRSTVISVRSRKLACFTRYPR